ncbi:MAG: tRNA glutamyl-Q(34) synthetase GluQRS [Rubrivivax sp.]|nr:tRNA glutamyl-Q(34) synthetase GluQRS [Rubrivivax sp.]
MRWRQHAGAGLIGGLPGPTPLTSSYRGRFAPTPSGPLHAGSLVAALASWLDARAHGGRWLVRIEDVDRPRCVAGAAEVILGQLARCALLPDEPVLVQSTRGAAHAAALDRLRRTGLAYDCACTRREIDEALAALGRAHRRHGERVYPGTCRAGVPPAHRRRPVRATRLLTLRGGAHVVIDWFDRRLGPQRQDVTAAVGDFVLLRADGCWSYQLAVVVDDAAQGITHVVRGEDLADNTARQLLLQRDLGLPTPQYLHTPLVLGADGTKLSKQNGAEAVDLADPVAALRTAGLVLGLPAIEAADAPAWLAQAVPAWAGIIARLPPPPSPVRATPATDPQPEGTPSP